MKKTTLILAFLMLMNFSLFAQTSNEKIEKFKVVNEQVVAKYKEGKYKEAARAAEEALALSIEIFGAEHIETAASYTNLGEVHRARKNYDESAANFEKAIVIYQKNPTGYEMKLAQVLKSLGTVLATDGKFQRAAEVLLNSLSNAEKAYGKESKELLPYFDLLSKIFVVMREFDSANEFFIKRYLAALKVFGKDSDQLDIIEDERYCSLTPFFDKDASHERTKNFREAIRNATKDQSTNTVPVDVIDGGIVNGKAVSMPKPYYPSSARAERASGPITVKISIDEQGKVTSAKALCGGHPALRQASEDAARDAKFSPTLLSGQPVKVIGIIVYNFVP